MGSGARSARPGVPEPSRGAETRDWRCGHDREEVGWRGVVRERLYNRLGGPVRGGMLGDVEVDDTSSIVGEHDEDEEYPQARGGHCEEINGHQVPDVVGEDVRQPWDGGVRRFGSSRETVRCRAS
jgi:hypothetical protein